LTGIDMFSGLVELLSVSKVRGHLTRFYYVPDGPHSFPHTVSL